MSKIILLATGDYVAELGYNLKNKLKNPDELVVINTHFDEAVQCIRQLEDQDIDVIISRGTWADRIKSEFNTIPVVKIPITGVEIMSAINLAKKKLKKDDFTIGYMGYKELIHPIKPFLDTLNLDIRIYEVKDIEDVENQISKAIKDKVDIIIAGHVGCEAAKKVGMNYIWLESSESSFQEAYTKALEIQNAVYMEKKKSKEISTILNSVSEAIISIDEFQNITTFNELAEKFTGYKSSEAIGKHIKDVCKYIDSKLLSKSMNMGEKVTGKVIEIRGKAFAISITPVTIKNKISNIIITLQEVSELQNVEIKVRKSLYLKGNVAQYNFDDIKGVSGEIKETIEMAKSFSQLESNVLIIGETGIGKELFAQSIHNLSSRREGPFVAVNCGAIPSTLINSEFFGYEEGAFTGAAKGGKIGLFELAHNGTIFLDEISEMDLYGQVTLLRVIQERQIRRVGGETIIPINVRIIAAANRNLYGMVKENKFRRDLFYRLSVLVLKVPPLRDRKKDISYLAEIFVNMYAEMFKKEISLSKKALGELEMFDWDGNVRQLKNFCERIVADFIKKQIHNSFYIENSLEKEDVVTEIHSITDGDKFIINKKGISYKRITDLITKYDGNRELIAKELKISRTTLWRYMKLLGISK
ncbi:sigma-54-dependent Fis family transcriptional regulator [Clostridium magnum]|uniref:Limonene hydroxylase n=1 Tax=Clostridium magnum DSM 2767 TaxID=1121326 RepID=A0A161X2B5_9CLOT|nr:sigma-54-dependent Fis family transcriptional regulator [Clostridium magnum]KZL93638.1 limonene hydroxylase [Clostridium magnum DSM 2767]SHI56710.1 PAS domain S-box-containing protein [Clostridium magnum DSM 2767]